MGIYSIKLKTHSRENITHKFENLNYCIIHLCQPEIFKIVAGSRKDINYIAVCKHDDCGKISDSEEDLINVWNKYN
jgi:hypothetical protein